MKRQLFVTLVVGILLSACGGGSSTSSGSTPTAPSTPSTPTTPSPQPTTTTFQGTIAGGNGSSGQSGTVNFTIQAVVATSSSNSPGAGTRTVGPLAVSQVSGTLHLVAGSTSSLTGSFDSSTNGVSLSGSGFALAGNLGNNVFSGTYTGPNGSSGKTSALNSTQTSVTLYCGTFQGHGSGTFNIAISGAGTASGTTSPADPGDGACVLSGQLVGSALTLSCSGGSSAAGTVQSGTVSGTTASGATFSGNACQ
jgi:hypothetical protein